MENANGNQESGRLSALWRKYTSGTYRQIVLYVFWGAMTTLVNFVGFFLLHKVCGVNYLVSNVICWVIAVYFAFFTNRSFVFHSTLKGFKPIFLESLVFAGGRLFSLGCEILLLALAVECLHFNTLLSKLGVTVLVDVLNFLYSKLVVFRHRK